MRPEIGYIMELQLLTGLSGVNIRINSYFTLQLKDNKDALVLDA